VILALNNNDSKNVHYTRRCQPHRTNADKTYTANLGEKDKVYITDIKHRK